MYNTLSRHRQPNLALAIRVFLAYFHIHNFNKTSFYDIE